VDTVDFGIIAPQTSITVNGFNSFIATAIQNGLLRPQATKSPQDMAPSYGYIRVKAQTDDPDVTPTLSFQGFANRTIGQTNVALTSEPPAAGDLHYVFKGSATFAAAPQNAAVASVDIKLHFDTTGSGSGKITFNVDVLSLLAVSEIQINFGRFQYASLRVFQNTSTRYISISLPSPPPPITDSYQDIAVAFDAPILVSLYGSGNSDPTLPTDADVEITGSYNLVNRAWSLTQMPPVFSYPQRAAFYMCPCPEDFPPFDNTLALGFFQDVNGQPTQQGTAGSIFDTDGSSLIAGTYHSLPPLTVNVGPPPAGQYWTHIVNLSSANGVLSGNVATNVGTVGPRATFDFSKTTFTSTSPSLSLKVAGSVAVPGSGTNVVPLDGELAKFVDA
jgi:hypothetical protein